MTRGYLALGSNTGDRLAHLRAAERALRAEPGIVVVRVAAIYETEAVGGVQQEPFLNTVVEIDTQLEPAALLDRVLGIERSMGRIRHERHGPRPIDIDVVWLDSGPVATDSLVVPHPEAHHRRFVLVPLQELGVDFRLAGRPLDDWLPAAEPKQIARVT